MTHEDEQRLEQVRRCNDGLRRICGDDADFVLRLIDEQREELDPAARLAWRWYLGRIDDRELERGLRAIGCPQAARGE